MYWLYSRTPSDYKFVDGIRYPTNTIDPDDLYFNEYSFYDACEDIVKSGKPFENYSVPDAMMHLWEEEMAAKKKYENKSKPSNTNNELDDLPF